MKTPTQKEIDAEIETLKSYINLVRPTSAFGEQHPPAIRTQIKVLEEGLNEDDVYDRYDGLADNILDNALYAASWLAGDVEDGTPSSGWKSLLMDEPKKKLVLKDIGPKSKARAKKKK